MKRTVIVGVGSPHGDDRAGWLVIDALDARLRGRAAADAETVALDRPGMTLLAHLRGADRAVLVDAIAGRDAPGTIAVVSAVDLQLDAVRASTHGVGVAEALTLGASLKMLPSALTLIGIVADPRAAGAAPSAPVRRAARQLASQLARWLREGGDVGQHALARRIPARSFHGRSASNSGGAVAASGDITAEGGKDRLAMDRLRHV